MSSFNELVRSPKQARFLNLVTNMRLRPLLALSLLAATAAGCGNSTTFHGKPIPPIAIAKGPGGGPATTVVEVDGTDSFDPNALDGSGIYTWEWTLAAAPAGSNATVTPKDGDERFAELTTDVAGKYIVQLRVRDINDFAWSEPTYYALNMFPITGIDFILRWNTAVNDVDLHLVNETDMGGFFEAPGDCFFQNLRPDWLPMGSLDGDPSLHHDEVNGFGPEILELPAPTLNHRYHAYVHYFSDDGLGHSDVVLEFWVNGTKVQEMTHDQLAGNEVWDAATVDWTGVDATITPVDSISTY